jgi:hypothetical protein
MLVQRFRPISVERPKVLMPLVNVPMLDYTLEWLASAGVEEARGTRFLAARRCVPRADARAPHATRVRRCSCSAARTPRRSTPICASRAG